MFIREGTEQCGIKVNYVKNTAFFFFLNEALTHVRLHPINTIKPRKKKSTTPLILGVIKKMSNFSNKTHATFLSSLRYVG